MIAYSDENWCAAGSGVEEVTGRGVGDRLVVVPPNSVSSSGVTHSLCFRETWPAEAPVTSFLYTFAWLKSVA